MSEAVYTPGRVTIGIVNYKTELLTRLCLRSLRKFTRKVPVQVVVVDNDSNDASLEYLRSLKWIKLIERPGEVMPSGSWAHASGVDLALDQADTEFFVSMHSDTIVHHPGWLEFLLASCPQDVACAGCGKLELKPQWEVTLKKYTDLKEWLRRLNPNRARNDFYIRTICAIFRTEILNREKLRFTLKVDQGVTCGKQLYYELVDRGYRTAPVTSYKMADYAYHLAHATMVLNPEFTVRSRTEKKCRAQLEKLFNSPLVKEIMADASLDQ